MNCNQCGEEVYTTPSQYTKFCKDCGKIVLKLETTSKLIPPIPPINQSKYTQPVYNQANNNNQQTQNSAYTPNAPVYEPASSNKNTTAILIASLVFGIMLIGGIIYYVQTKNNPNLNGTVTEEAVDATVVVEEAATEAVEVAPQTTNTSTTYTNQNTTSANFTDDYFTTKINNYYQAESNRNFDELYSNYLSTATYYYDIVQPNYDKLKERFEHLWSITSDASNNIKSYTVNRYDAYTEVIVLLDFSFFALKSQEYKTKTDIRVAFNFDKNGNITSIFEQK